MARFAVEILIKSAGAPQAKAAMEGIGAGARSASPAVEKLVGQMLGFEINLRGLGGLIGKAFAGFSAISIGKQIIQETREAQAAMAQLEAGVKSTGGAAGYSAAQLGEMADRLSRLSGIDDEVIAGGEAILLTFRRVGHEAFEPLMKLALDLSVRLGKDLNSTLLMLGKAAEMPKTGMTALARAGVQFSDSQKEVISKLVDSGHLLEAQKILMRELEIQVGGSAAAYRDTLGGALDALKVSWGNFLERVGNGGSAFRDVVEGMIKILDGFADAWHNVEGVAYVVLQTLTQLIGGFVTDVLFALEMVARGAQAVINAVPFQGDETKKAAANAVAWISGLRQTTTDVVLAMDEGFGEKAAAAFANVGGEVKGLDKSIVSLGTDSEGASKAMQRLAEQAAKVVEAARLDLQNTEASLQARRLGVEAMKLEGTIQEALARARAAGAGATAKQRVEIIQLTLATAAAKDGIDRINQAEKDLPGLFEASNKSMMRQLDILVDLDKITRGFQADVNAANAAQVEAGGAEMTAKIKAQLEAAKQLAAYLREPIASAARYMRDTILDNIAAAASGAKVSWSDMWKSFLEIAIRAVEEWLVRWITAQHIAQAEAAKTGAVNAAAGGGGGAGGGGMGFGGMGGGGFLGGAGRAMMGNPMTSGGYSAYGSALWGAVVVGAMFAIKNWIRQQGVRDGHAALGVEGGRVTSSQSGKYIGASAKAQMKADELAAAVAATLNQIMTSLGGAFESLAADLRIGRHGQGKKAYYTVKFLDAAGKLVELRFKEFDAAMEAAVIQALRTSQTFGLSSEVQTALRNTTAETLDQLKQDIDTAMAAVHARLGATGSQVYDTFRGYEQQIAAARKLGLATDDLVAARERDLASIRNSLLGVDTSTADFLASLASYNRGILEATAATRQATETQLAAAQANLADLLAAGPQRIEGENGRGYTQTQEMWEREVARVRGQVARYIDELDKIPRALSDQEINMGIFDALYKYLEGNQKYSKQAVEYARMKVEIEFAAIKAQLIALGKWEEFATMFDDAYRAAREAAGKPRGGRGGGRADARESALDQLADMRARAAGGVAEAMLQYERAVREWDKVAKEGKLTAAQRAEGERLLRQEMQKTLREQMNNLAGRGGGLEDRYREAQKFFDDLQKAGRKETGIPDWEVRLRRQQAVMKLGGEAMAALGDQTALAQQQLGPLAEAMSFLRNHADELGLSTQRLGEIAQQTSSQLVLSIAGSLDQYIEDEDVKRQLAEIRFRMDLANAQVQIEMAFSLGLLLQADYDFLKGLLDLAGNFDPGKLISAGSGGGGRDFSAQENLVKAQQDAAKAFLDLVRTIDKSNKDLLTDHNLSALSPQGRLAAAVRMYEETFAKAKAGDVQALRDYTGVRQTALELMRAAENSGPKYAEFFDKVFKEGASLALSADTERNAVANLIKEQTDSAQQGTAAIVQELMGVRSSVVEGLNNLARVMGQPPIVNGIPKFAAGGIATRPSLAGEGRYPEAIVPLPGARAIPVQFTGGGANDNSTAKAVTDSGISIHRVLSRSLDEQEKMRVEINRLNAKIEKLTNASRREKSREDSDKRQQGRKAS